MRMHRGKALRTPAVGLVLRLRSIGIQWGRSLYVIEWYGGDGGEF